MIRYLVPNGITAMSLAFGVLSIQASLRGDARHAAWWILTCVLTDKLDGIAARALKASSEFGLQLDSMADLVSFGVAPAALVYGFFTAHADAGWAAGWQRPAIAVIAVGYAVAAAVRLARFNIITGEAPGSDRFFFGIPSTFAGAIVASTLLLLIKYGEPAWGGATAGDWRLLGAARLDRLMPWLPWLVVVAAAAMVAPLRVPKIGKSKIVFFDVALVGNAALCAPVMLLRRLPEYLAATSLVYFTLALGFHLVVRSASQFKPPPYFSKRAA